MRKRGLRTAAVIFAGALSLSLAACGEKEAEKESPAAEASGQEKEGSGESSEAQAEKETEKGAEEKDSATDKEPQQTDDVSAEDSREKSDAEGEAAGDAGTGMTDEELYACAVKDAMTVEPEEILPVISLSEGSADAVYNDEGEVLLLTWHRFPDSYPQGEEVSSEWGTVWTFSPVEIQSWYDENKEGVGDWDQRFRQLIGLTPDTENTHFTAMWVSPEDVIRPAYVTDIGDITMTGSFETEPDAAYKEWFDGNIIGSYFDGAYPWTRLGYTYDWADNGEEYGLSEFLVEPKSLVNVEYTCTTEEFLERLEDGNTGALQEVAAQE